MRLALGSSIPPLRGRTKLAIGPSIALHATGLHKSRLREQDLERDAPWPRIRRAWRIEQLENGPRLFYVESALSRRGGDRAERPRPQSLKRRNLQRTELHSEAEHLAQEAEHVRCLRQMPGRDDLRGEAR